MDSCKITFTTDEGEKSEFYIIEQTKLNNFNYILVTKENYEEEEISECFIMKDISDKASSEAVYEFVNDEKEYDILWDVFIQLLGDDFDLE